MNFRIGRGDSAAGYDDWLLVFLEAESAVPEGARLFAPKTPCRYGSGNRIWHHSWIHFSGPGIKLLVERSGLAPGAFLLCPLAAAEHRLEALAEELDNGAPPDAMIVANLLENLLREVGRRRHGGPVVPERLRRALALMDTRRPAPKMTELAQTAGLSVPHFTAEFKRIRGISPGAYVQ